MIHLCYVDAPPAPSNLAVTELSTEGSDRLRVYLTWSQNDSHCVVMYHVEETFPNDINNINTTSDSQNITLTLQIGVVYSFRVRGVDSIDRLGEWSDFLMYNSTGIHACISQYSSNNELAVL